jgi:hypothetical protein
MILVGDELNLLGWRYVQAYPASSVDRPYGAKPEWMNGRVMWLRAYPHVRP